jgi:hypothetical protein
MLSILPQNDLRNSNTFLRLRLRQDLDLNHFTQGGVCAAKTRAGSSR